MYYLQVQLVWSLHACGHQTILIINVSHLEGVSGKSSKILLCVRGLLWWSDGGQSGCHAGDLGLIPGLGKIP